MAGAFTHRVAVRYAEVDLQGVVFNAHYLTWVDDAMSAWMADVGFTGASWALGGGEDVTPDEDVAGWDVMVRHADLDWVGSAGFGDVVDVGCSVSRWGTSSFDVRFELSVDDRVVAVVVLTYVGVRRAADGTLASAPVPESFRRALS